MPELTDAQRDFLDQYAKSGGMFGKKKARKKSDALKAEYLRFNKSRDEVYDRVMKMTGEILKNELLEGLDKADRAVKAATDAAEVRLASSYLDRVAGDIPQPQGNGKDQAPQHATQAKQHSEKRRKDFVHANEKKGVMKRENERGERIKEKIPEITKAIQNLNDAIEDLRKQRAEAKSPAKMSELVDVYAEKKAQLKHLQGLLSQYEGFDEGKAARIDSLIEAEDRLVQGQTEANALAAAIAKDPTGQIDGIVVPLGPVGGEFVSGEVADVDKKNKSLSERVKFEANRTLRTGEVYPGEPEITVISKEQEKYLNTLLSNARGLIDPLMKGKKVDKSVAKRSLNYAAALHNKVEADLTFFIRNRAEGLPPPAEPPVDRGEILGQMLDRLEQRVADMRALGEDKMHGGLSKSIGEFRDKLKDPKNFDKVSDKLDKLKVEIEGFIEKLERRAPSKTRKKANKAAGDAARNVAQKMLELYDTKPIKDISKIEEPGASYGNDGPPKDMIPRDQVLEITNEDDTVSHYQIKVKKQKGQYVTERKKKGVPRAVMDMLMGRADTLDMMTESMAEGCEAAIDAYAKETQDMLEAYTSNDAEKAFKKIEELMARFENKGLKNVLVLEYVPHKFGEVKQDWEEFKSRQPTMAPGVALTKAEEFRDDIQGLLNTAVDTEKKHKKNDELWRAVMDDLTFNEFDSETDGELLSSRMKALFEKDALEKAEAFLEEKPKSQERKDIVSSIKAAMASMEEQTEKNKKVKPGDMQGPWRRKLLEARKVNDVKSEDAVGRSETLILSIKKEVDDFKDHFAVSVSGGPTDEELAGLLKSVAAKMQEGADGTKEHLKQVHDYQKDVERIETLLERVKKMSQGHPNQEDLDDRRRAYRSQLQAITSEAKRSLLYANANGALEKLMKDLKILGAAAGQSSSGTSGKDPVEKQINDLAGALEKLSEAADKLIDKRARNKVTDEQNKDYPKLDGHLTKTEKSLKLVANVADASDLKKIAKKIDAAEINKDSKKEKIARREGALSLLHKLRSRIDTHPAVKLYHENPFDSGAAFSSLRNYLHHAEIGILTSVNPRKK